MPPKPRPFRLVYRVFEYAEFDPTKSAEVFEARGFDLGYVSHIFPGYVLEREDTRPYLERRFQVVGELQSELYFVVYTPRGRGCRLITAWTAEPRYWELWNDLTR